MSHGGSSGKNHFLLCKWELSDMIDWKKLKKWYCMCVSILIVPCLIVALWGRINRDQLMQLEYQPLWVKIYLTIVFILFTPAYIAAFRGMIETRWLFWTWIILHTAFLAFIIIVYWFWL